MTPRWYDRPAPTPESDLGMARYVGRLTRDGWTDALPVTSDAGAIRFLTDFRTYCALVTTPPDPVTLGATEAGHSAPRGDALGKPTPSAP